MAALAWLGSVDAEAADQCSDEWKCPPGSDICDIFYEITSAKLLEIEEGGARYRLWQGRFDMDGPLDGIASGRSLARADLSTETAVVSGFGTFVASHRSMFPATELLWESWLTFPGSNGGEWDGVMIIHAPGARVTIALRTDCWPYYYHGSVTEDP